MDARRARHLGDAGDGTLDVRRRRLHEISQFVDNDHDVVKLVRNDDLLLARHPDLRDAIDVFLDAAGLRRRLVGDRLDGLGPAFASASASSSFWDLGFGRALKLVIFRTPDLAKIL